MKLPNFHYYFRFLLGLSTWEIYGIVSLIILILLSQGLKWIWNDQIEPLSVQKFEPKFLDNYVAELESEKRRKREFRKFKFGNYENKASFKYRPWVPNKPMFWKRAGPEIQKKVDINQADSITWVGMKGIGPSFAHRILMFRDKLGGFFSIDQLKEVYGLDSLWVKENQRRLILGKGIYRKFQVNKLEWKEFRHPYLPYPQAKLFLAYRKQHGSVQNWEELIGIKLIDSKVWERLRPYLDFESQK